MRLLTDIKRFIRKDTQAEIQTEGLVGNKFVSLKIGEAMGEEVEEGGSILAKDPVSFADIIEETQGIMAYTKQMTEDFAGIVRKINSGEGTIGKVINDDKLYYAATDLTESAGKSLNSITGELNTVTEQFKKLGNQVQSVVNNINEVVTGVDTLLYNVSMGKGVVGSLLVEGTPEDSTMKETFQNLSDLMSESKSAASKLAENMEALKHNWLFKSYFEDRGYWDTEEYEKEIDSKTQELNQKIMLLDKKIEELKTLEARNK